MPCLLFLDEQIYTKGENHCIMLSVIQNIIVLNFARKVKSDLSPLDSQNLRYHITSVSNCQYTMTIVFGF